MCCNWELQHIIVLPITNVRNWYIHMYIGDKLRISSTVRYRTVNILKLAFQFVIYVHYDTIPYRTTQLIIV